MALFTLADEDQALLLPAVLPAYNVSMRPPLYDGPAMRVLSWNVASLRAMLTKASTRIKLPCLKQCCLM